MVDLLTLQEVASMLKLHPRTVMKMAIAGEIPGAKVGRKWRFDKGLIEDWLAVRMVPKRLNSGHSAGFIRPSELVTEREVVLLSPAPARKDILRLLASHLSLASAGVSLEELVQLLEEREAMFPTVVEGGVAFPHPSRPLRALPAPLLVLGVVPEGVAYGAADHSLTYVLALLCSPDERTHLHLLSILARIFRVPATVEQMRSARSRQEVRELLLQAEQKALEDLISVREEPKRMTETIMTLLELQSLDNELRQGKAKETPYRAKKRRELIQRIPEPVMRNYQRLSTRHPNAVVPVIDGTCQGCYVQLPALVLVRLQNPRDQVYCDRCGRILYKP